MKLYVKQKVFSFADQFSVIDDQGQAKYWAEGEFFSLVKRLHVSDVSGEEVITIEQELFSFMPRYKVFYKGRQFATIRGLFRFRPTFEIEGPGWYVEGNLLGLEYTIYDGEATIATIQKKWMSWGDSYEIDIVDDLNELPVLAIVLGIDAAAARSSS